MLFLVHHTVCPALKSPAITNGYLALRLTSCRKHKTSGWFSLCTGSYIDCNDVNTVGNSLVPLIMALISSSLLEAPFTFHSAIFIGSGRSPSRGVHYWMHRSRISGGSSILVLNELRHKVRNRFGQFLRRSLCALLIAICCAIKSRNIVVVSSDAARGVGSWLFNAVFSARRSSIFFVIFSISSDKAVRRSSVDTSGAAAPACTASRSPRTLESSTVNCATFAESCCNCSDAHCIAEGVNEAVGGDVFCNLASAAVIAILTSFTDRVASLQALHITINGIFELGVRERVPHVGVWSLSTADSTHFGHAIAPFAFEKRSCQIFASSGEIVGSVWLPWPGVPGAATARACAGIGKVRTCV